MTWDYRGWLYVDTERLAEMTWDGDRYRKGKEDFQISKMCGDYRGWC